MEKRRRCNLLQLFIIIHHTFQFIEKGKSVPAAQNSHIGRREITPSRSLPLLQLVTHTTENMAPRRPRIGIIGAGMSGIVSISSIWAQAGFYKRSRDGGE